MKPPIPGSPMPEAPNGFSQRYSTIIQTVTVVGLFVGAFWGAVIQPLASRLDGIEHNTISRAEFREFGIRLDAEILRLTADSEKQRDGLVTRGEHTQKWAADAATFANLQRQIDDTRKELGGTWSMRDALVQLQTRIDRMENWSHSDHAQIQVKPAP